MFDLVAEYRAGDGADRDADIACIVRAWVLAGERLLERWLAGARIGCTAAGHGGAHCRAQQLGRKLRRKAPHTALGGGCIQDGLRYWLGKFVALNQHNGISAVAWLIIFII